jgi:hypothetical protein
MSLSRNEAAMERDPGRDEQGADERFQPVKHQHRACGPFAHEPARRGDGVYPEGGKKSTDAHRLK